LRFERKDEEIVLEDKEAVGECKEGCERTEWKRRKHKRVH